MLSNTKNLNLPNELQQIECERLCTVKGPFALLQACYLRNGQMVCELPKRDVSSDSAAADLAQQALAKANK